MLVDLGAVPVAQTGVQVLAQDPAPPPGKGDEFGKASPIGLVVIILLFLATVVLIRSMNKHLRKVPASFDGPVATSPDSGPGSGPDTGPGTRGAADTEAEAATAGTRPDDPADGPARD